jgi:hypothetical protein
MNLAVSGADDDSHVAAKMLVLHLLLLCMELPVLHLLFLCCQ